MKKKVDVDREVAISQSLNVSRAVLESFPNCNYAGMDISLNGTALSFLFDMNEEVFQACSRVSFLLDTLREFKVKGSFTSLYVYPLKEIGKGVMSFSINPSYKANELGKMKYLKSEVERILSSPSEEASRLIQEAVLFHEKDSHFSNKEKESLYLDTIPLIFSDTELSLLKIAYSSHSYFTSIEDVNVSSNFSGVRAVAAAFGIVCSSLNSEHCPFVLYSPKTTMESFVRKKKDLLFSGESFKATDANSRKLGALELASLLSGTTISNNDVADSICHALMAMEIHQICSQIIKTKDIKFSNSRDILEKYREIKAIVEKENCFSSLPSLISILQGGISKSYN